MSLFAIWEPEETIGNLWHRFVGDARSQPRFPGHAVPLASVERHLAVFFRGLGGRQGTDFKAIPAQAAGYRMRFKEKLGQDRGEVVCARFDGETLFLPEALDVFPDTALNGALYKWMAAWAAAAGESPPRAAGDPLQADLAFLRFADATRQRLLADFPGLSRFHDPIAGAVLQHRPQRRLPEIEQQVETCVLHLLGGAAPGGAAAVMLAAIETTGRPLEEFHAPKRYQPFLPVVLWNEILPLPARQRARRSDEQGGGQGAPDQDETGPTKKARRHESDLAERKDSLILHRFESILSWTEMMNINRTIEDDDEDNARRAADDHDEIGVGDITQKAATKLKFDLDLAPGDVEREALSGTVMYREWDHRKNAYYENFCRVLSSTAELAGADTGWQPDEAARKRIRAVKRQFEALRPKREIARRQLDGQEFDIDALIRSRCDMKADGEGSNRIYLQSREQARDLAVAVLIDVSRSTESWIEGRQVLDIAKEALLALSLGLAACGDDNAIYSFSSLKRDRVWVSAIKDFDEPLGAAVFSRISALTPGFYTRLGAAVRHVSAELSQRPNMHRLLLVLTDGKPNDLDHYEGRYGVEDTAMAVREARHLGQAVFGMTIDARAQNYFPRIFGANAHAIVSRASHLTKALPLLYRHLVS